MSVERRRILERAGFVLGSLCVVAALALALPGLRIARADDEAPAAAEASHSAAPAPADPAPIPAAPSCSAAARTMAGDEASIREQQLLLEREIARRAAGAASAAQSSEDGIVLNGRGYNYGPPDGRPPGL